MTQKNQKVKTEKTFCSQGQLPARFSVGPLRAWGLKSIKSWFRQSSCESFNPTNHGSDLFAAYYYLNYIFLLVSVFAVLSGFLVVSAFVLSCVFLDESSSALLPSAALVALWLPHDDATAIPAQRHMPKNIFFMVILLRYCLSNLPDPVLVLSVGAPSDFPILCESASAAVCDESFTVPAWSALPVIIGESA